MRKTCTILTLVVATLFGVVARGDTLEDLEKLLLLKQRAEQGARMVEKAEWAEQGARMVEKAEWAEQGTRMKVTAQYHFLLKRDLPLFSWVWVTDASYGSPLNLTKRDLQEAYMEGDELEIERLRDIFIKLYNRTRGADLRQPRRRP